jgi:aryl-alcohol dehydrogenase-like predicted oxidoreductase
MKYRPLGETGIDVSVICLGSMTFGEQNTEAQAHAQLDYAFEHGVTFIDTAQMYPTPPRAETQGRTEAFIGTWLNGRNRDDVVLATKITGPGLATVPGHPFRLTEDHIRRGIEGSLKRLGTDYVDLYQVHWPDRPNNRFGAHGYKPVIDAQAVPIEETLRVLSALVAEGKVRHVGISNETPWGVMQYLNAARALGLERIVSIQNPYSLLNRTFEVGLAEMSFREHVGLLAYSPLAFGVLSGKYLGGAQPAGARLTLYERFSRYSAPHVDAIAGQYVALAQAHGLDPAQMALAFVNAQAFLTSTIIGATNLEQLASNVASADLTLSAEVMAGIEEIHLQHPNPCP